MARIGLYPALIIVAFGIVAPFFIFKFGRLLGFGIFLAALKHLREVQIDFVVRVVAAKQAYESVKAGRTRTAEEYLEELRAKHGFPR